MAARGGKAGGPVPCSAHLHVKAFTVLGRRLKGQSDVASHTEIEIRQVREGIIGTGSLYTHTRSKSFLMGLITVVK